MAVFVCVAVAFAKAIDEDAGVLIAVVDDAGHGDDVAVNAILCLDRSGVITECKLRGFRVPEDISVVGFDDIPISSMLEPPLTTIRQERSELGKCAYVILNSLVHHIPICRTQLRAALIERESTARYQAPVKKI